MPSEDDISHSEARRTTVAIVRELTAALDAQEDQRDADRIDALQARLLVNEMFQFVGLVSTDGILLAANGTVIEAGGLKPSDVIGVPVWETHWWTVDQTTMDGVRDAIRRAAAGELVRYDVDVRVDGPNLRTIDFSAKPVHDGAGQVAFLVLEGRDIDEKKRAEAALERKHRELAAATRKLTQLDRAKSRLFANISHELRTPLALILGSIEQLEARHREDPEAQRRLRVAHDQATQLRRRVDDLLDITRLDTGKIQPRYRRTDIARLLRLAASHFEPVADTHDIEIGVYAPAGLAAEVDPDQVFRILLNLISNAVKFVPGGGHIRCSAQSARDGRSLVVEVADSGPGLPAADRRRIFKRFEQGDDGDTRAFGGTGLGLAIVQELVRLHRGHIVADSAPEGGALFRLELPRDAPEGVALAADGDPFDEAGIARQTAHELRPRAARQGLVTRDSRPLVLVVEDNADMQDHLVDLLSERYGLALAANGADGLRAVREFRPDIVICDVMMPRMGGEQMIRELNSHPLDRDIPVVALTAKVDDDLRNRFFRLGVQDFVTKPFGSDDLLARLDRLARSRLVDSATRDPLTGLWNRGKVEDFIDWQVARSRRYRTPFSLLLIDIDHFKRVNDLRGHAAGDQMLTRLADIAGRIIRDSDLLGRWGGEEFVVITPETPLDDAAVLAEKLRAAIAAELTEDRSLTISVGVAQHRGDEDCDGLFARVDSALYRAKRGGRDRVALER